MNNKSKISPKSRCGFLSMDFLHENSNSLPKQDGNFNGPPSCKIQVINKPSKLPTPLPHFWPTPQVWRHCVSRWHHSRTAETQIKVNGLNPKLLNISVSSWHFAKIFDHQGMITWPMFFDPPWAQVWSKGWIIKGIDHQKIKSNKQPTMILQWRKPPGSPGWAAMATCCAKKLQASCWTSNLWVFSTCLGRLPAHGVDLGWSIEWLKECREEGSGRKKLKWVILLSWI